MINKIDHVYSNGGYFEGEGWRIVSLKYQPLQPARKPVLSVGIQVAPQTMVLLADGSPQHFDGGPNQLTIRLTRRGDEWLVSSFERLS